VSDNEGLALLISFFAMVVGGYLLAWKAKSGTFRAVGTSFIAVVAGLLGLFFLAQAVGVLTDPPPNGPWWYSLMAVPLLLVMPSLCFAIAVIFVRRALRHREDGKKFPIHS
jgi:hypothetical protein